VVCCCIGFLVQNLRGLLHTTVEATPNITAEAQEVGGVIVGPMIIVGPMLDGEL
jgi:hypothetical protein